MKVTLLAPVLNEVDTLREMMPSFPRHLFEQILILDGKSTDGSAEYCRSQGFEVYVQKEPGLRVAYYEAWPLIRGDYVLTFSPDGNCKLSDLEPLIAKAGEGYDMVIGSRYYKGATSEDDTVVTGFGNWFFT